MAGALGMQKRLIPLYSSIWNKPLKVYSVYDNRIALGLLSVLYDLVVEVVKSRQTCRFIISLNETIYFIRLLK